MCEKCDALQARLDAMSPEERTKMHLDHERFNAARTEALIDLVKFVNDFATKHGDVGAPAVTMALALALGGCIGRAPGEIRELVAIGAIQSMVNAANGVIEDGAHLHMSAQHGHGPRREQPRSEFTVKPPTMH
jgi:hypothetical protein